MYENHRIQILNRAMPPLSLVHVPMMKRTGNMTILKRGRRQ